MLQLRKLAIAKLLLEDSSLRAANKLLGEDHLIKDDKDTYLKILEQSKKTFRDEMEKIITVIQVSLIYSVGHAWVNLGIVIDSSE